ncbi:MAG: MarR family transcriptional regulator [Nitrososphaerales archaeon]|nr:MarR family transcriptional regulator [Nitrososphaerales archaeon]
MVSVKGSRSVSSLQELEERFYQSTLQALLSVATLRERFERMKKTARTYVPWVAEKAVDAAGLVFPPAFLASDAVKEGIEKLLDRAGLRQPEKLVLTKEVDRRLSIDLLLNGLSEKGVEPVFTIDELDKVPRDDLLSEFFDGNQEWFQGKRSMISLSHSFGEAIKDSLVTSVARFSSVEHYKGITSLNELKEILRPRLVLGLSQVAKDESEAETIASELFSEEALKTILDLYVPNTHLMLESAYAGLERAKKERAEKVLPRHIEPETTEERHRVPTGLERLILDELSREGRLTPSDLSERLDKKAPSIVRALSSMLNRGWVGRVGERKRAYYHITQKGEAARRSLTRERVNYI